MRLLAVYCVRRGKIGAQIAPSSQHVFQQLLLHLPQLYG
jgi:hypothetical protein